MRRMVLAVTIVSLAASTMLVAARIPSGAQPLVQPTPTATPTAEPCNDDWRQIDRDDNRSGNWITGVATRSADRAFVVGHTSTRRGQPIPLIKEWNGSSWDRKRVKGRFYLHDVDAGRKGPVWAVGEGSSGSTLSSYALKRSPSGEWRRSSIVNVSPTLTAIHDVSALGPRAVWATGNYWDSAARHRVLIERYNGKRWRHIGFAPTGLAEDVFARARDDVWVVGRTGRNGNQVTLTIRYNGKRWRTVRSPNVDDRPHILNGVVATGRRKAWAVGSRVAGRGSERPLIMRWNGKRWRYLDVFSKSKGALKAISAHGDELVAVGQNDSFEAMVFTFDGTRWSREILQTRDSDEIHDVEHAPNGSVYAAGLRSTSGGSEAVFFRPPLCP